LHRFPTFLPLALLLFLIAPHDPATAQSLRLLDSFVGDQSGFFPGVGTFDRLAYAAEADRLAVFERSDPDRPRRIATLQLPGPVSDLAATADGLLFLACGPHGLLIVNAANPYHPDILSTIETPGDATAVALRGNLALVADAAAGLQIIDIADPSAPALLGGLLVNSPLFDVAVTGERVVVAFAYCGPSPLALSGIAVALCRVRVATLDLADPAAPAVVGQIDLTTHFLAPVGTVPGRVMMRPLAENQLALAAAGIGLVMIDVSNPARPGLIAQYEIPLWLAPRGLAVADGLAYLLDQENALHIFDIAQPFAPALLSQFPAAADIGSGSRPLVAQPNALLLDGDRLHVAGGLGGLDTLDLADPANPRPLAAADYPDYAYGIAVDGDTALLIDGFFSIADHNRLLLLDARDNAPLPPVATFQTPARFLPAVALTDTRVYALEQQGATAYAVQILDRTASGTLALRADHPLPSSFSGYSDLAVAGDLLFVTTPFRLRIYNVADPAVLAEIADFATTFGNRIRVSGNRLLLANRGGLQILDISQPANPALIGQLNPSFPVSGSQSPVGPNGFCISGSTAFIAGGSHGIRIVDFADPANPVQRAVYAAFVTVGGLALAGDRLLAADTNNGLLVFDVSDPAAPDLLRRLPFPQPVADVAIAGDRVFVADTGAGLYLYQLQTVAGIPAAAALPYR
jgi:hypothetical protein